MEFHIRFLLLLFVCYLAPNYVWEEVLFYSCESVCLSVCLSVCEQDNSKSSRPISMKFGRKLVNQKRKVKSDVDKNRPDRAQTSSKRNFQNAISKKVLDRFRWQLRGSLVIIKERSSSNLTRIALIECKPRPIFQNHIFPDVRV